MQVSRQLEVQEQLLKGLEAQLKEREKAVAGEGSDRGLCWEQHQLSVSLRR